MIKQLLLMLTALVCASACVVGAPPGFSDGDEWSVPLVASLENDLLLVPVSIEGKGPFLFMVDPDSTVSSIESSLVASLDLYAGRTSQEGQTEDDHLVKVIIAEIKKMTIGTLKVRSLRVRVHSDGTYWSGGRRVHGILGRDIISDSLIYSFDRDRAMMYIGTQGHLKAPEGSQSLKFTQNFNVRHRRYLAKIKINHRHKLSMHLDLGARTSMLWPSLIKKFKLPKIPVQAEVVDEYGTKRTINSGTIAGIVEASKTETNAILMLPYGDKRMEPEDLDGIIGQNFWSKYNVTVNWHHKKFWLQPRAQDLAQNAAERIGRWGDQLSGCDYPACVVASLEGRPEPAAPPSQASPETDGSAEGPPGAAPAAAGVPASEENPDATTAPDAAPAPDAPAPEAIPGPERPSEAPPSPAPGERLTLLIERQAPGNDFAYDVVIGAVDGEGKALKLPLFLASFRSGVQSMMVSNLDPDYAQAAGFAVFDMNPVGTRGCEGARCVYAQPFPR